MRFASESADLIVWNKDKNEALCKFKNFECETDDPYIIDKLKDYEVIDDGQETENTKGQEDKEQQVEDLRQEAKEKGIKGWNNMKYENLIEKLKGDSHAKSI